VSGAQIGMVTAGTALLHGVESAENNMSGESSIVEAATAIVNEYGARLRASEGSDEKVARLAEHLLELGTPFELIDDFARAVANSTARACVDAATDERGLPLPVLGELRLLAEWLQGGAR
jgi:hypothetical protein